MATVVTREHVFYAFSPDLQPAARVRQGEEVVLETHDCFQGQIQTEMDLMDNLNWEHINPATGPVFIEGVRPGDVLRVDLLEVKPLEQSVVCAVPDEGVIGGRITSMETAVLRHEGNFAIFKGKVAIPVKPMVGVIGVAPASGQIATANPGDHGGNMDCILVGTGARLYLTAGVEGALLGAGDLHAVMGDGEIVSTGAETPGVVRLKAQVVPVPGLPTPFIENDSIVAVVASAATMDEAARMATDRMAEFLTTVAGLPVNDAGMLMSLVGDLKFCQVVDPLMTMRFEFPKWVLAEYGFTMPG